MPVPQSVLTEWAINDAGRTASLHVGRIQGIIRAKMLVSDLRKCHLEAPMGMGEDAFHFGAIATLNAVELILDDAQEQASIDFDAAKEKWRALIEGTPTLEMEKVS